MQRFLFSLLLMLSGQWTVFYSQGMNLGPSGDFFYYPFKVGERGRAGDFTVIDTDSISTLTDTLTAGVHIQANYMSGKFDDYRDVYFGKGIGITRFTVDTIASWNLINYEIKK